MMSMRRHMLQKKEEMMNELDDKFFTEMRHLRARNSQQGSDMLGDDLRQDEALT